MSGTNDKPALEELEDDQVLHISPTFGREHVTDHGACWCEPRVEFVEGGAIIFHKSEQ